MPVLPSTTALKMFREAARRSSFAGAADVLNVSQAAISKQVSALEARLGVSLFERGHRSVALTAAGRSYFSVAERVIALLENGGEEAVSVAAREKLTVEIDHEFLDFFLVPRLEQLRTALPSVDFHFVPESSASRRSGPACDLAITYGHPGERSIGVERLCEFTVFAIGAPSLVAGSAAPLTDLPLLHDVDTSWWEAILASENVVRRDIGIVLGHGAVAIRAAIAGLGLAVGDDLLCADALASGDLMPVGAARLPGRADYWLSSNPSSRATTSARAFRTWLVGEVTRHRRKSGTADGS